MPSYDTDRPAKIRREFGDYKIKQKQKDNAKLLKVTIKPAEDYMKKIDVFDAKGNKLASIGGRYYDGPWYGDYATFLADKKDRYGNDVNAKERKRLYLLRHKHEAKQKKVQGPKKGGVIVQTPSYWADKILWT